MGHGNLESSCPFLLQSLLQLPSIVYTEGHRELSLGRCTVIAFARQVCGRLIMVDVVEHPTHVLKLKLHSCCFSSFHSLLNS